MRGFATVDGAPSPDVPDAGWSELCADAVGNVIEFWGFKRNHGRLWCLLFLEDRAMSAAELMDRLALSKGAVSMITRELERWRVVRRVRGPEAKVWHYEAETDLLTMISHVLNEREAVLIESVRDELGRAEELAKRERVDPATLTRIRRLRQVAEVMHSAVQTLAGTARFDLRRAIEILRGTRDRLGFRSRRTR